MDELVLNAAMKEDGRFQGELLYEEVDSLSEEESLNRLTLWNQGKRPFSCFCVNFRF